MKSLSRSTALKIAAALSFLLSASSIVSTLPMIAQGATAINQGNGGPPYFIVLISLVLGIVGVVAAYGTWKQQRWGIVLTILANAVNGLSAAPGILFAPVPALTVVAIVTVIISILIIVLCLWRDRKLATA